MHTLYVIGFVVCLALAANAATSGGISPIYFTLTGSSAYDIFWVQDATTTAFLLTNNGVTHQLYRSTDNGMKWLLQQLPNTDTCYVVKIYADSIDPQKLLLMGPPEFNCGWYTLDAGKTYNYITVPGLEYISFNQNKTGWALGRTADSQVYYTSDLGAHWTQINASYATWAPRPITGSAWGGVFMIRNGNFGYSYDQGATFTSLSEDILELQATSNFVYALAQNRTLIVGQDEANLRLAFFPFGNAVPYMYSVSDDSSGATWFFTDANMYWGNIYTAGGNGALYIESLTHVLKRDDAFLDFHSVRGLPGVHLANVIINYNDHHDLRLRTYITYDNGGDWSILPSPQASCDECSLNLNFNRLGQRAYYSSSHTIGFILANGVVGSSLSYEFPIGLNPYLSRDAGQTWEKLKVDPPGPYVFEFGMNGGILVMAPEYVATKTIYYSFDQGITLNSLALSSSVYVTRILTQSSSASSVFVLFTLNDQGSGIVYSINFAGAQPSVTCSDADYETWSPSDTVNSTCWLGTEVVYSRRIRNATCTDTRGEIAQSSTACKCTIEDYECDFGFSASGASGPLTCSITGELPPTPPPACHGVYEQTQGFRLVPGDQCDVSGGLDKRPLILKCSDLRPVDKSGSSKGWVAGVVVVAVIVVVVGLVAFIIYRDPVMKEKVTSFFGRRRYGRVGLMRSSSLAHEEDFGIQDDLLDEDEDEAKVLHDNDISSATLRS